MGHEMHEMSRVPRVRFETGSGSRSHSHSHSRSRSSPGSGARLVPARELLPGDLLALSARDVVAGRWCVVMRTEAEGPGLVRVTVRSALSAGEREEVFDRDWDVIVSTGASAGAGTGSGIENP